MPDATPQVRRKLFWMVAIALALRLLVMVYLYPLQLGPGRDHWAFGYETGRIARSIATGHGFSSPLFGDTGPTAWMTPVYPYIVAAIFKIFGVFTTASALVILSMNALTSALTCVPIFFFTRKSFGEKAGDWASWIWVVFPYAVYWPVERIWDTWLATLLLAILFWTALHLAESVRVRDWIGFGLLSGVAALTDPVVFSALPFLALWALWRLYKTRRLPHAVLPAIGAVLAVILVVSPWFIRNYRVFHKFIPFRDNFALALRVGNVGDQFNMLTLEMGPWQNDQQWQEYQKYGEIAYMQLTWQRAMQYIRMHRR
jgi:4-amino-4-deoxy-L-arabinose transferase-like glycosyltransferase